MAMRKSIEEACDTIDSAVFSGDAFHDSNHRKEIRNYMIRWERELKSFDSLDEEDDGDPILEEDKCYPH